MLILCKLAWRWGSVARYTDHCTSGPAFPPPRADIRFVPTTLTNIRVKRVRHSEKPWRARMLCQSMLGQVYLGGSESQTN